MINSASFLRTTIVSAAILACFAASPAYAALWYADANSAAKPPDGTSWATAFPTIQAAVNSAAGDGGGEVWVADGTYSSASGVVLVMAANVHLYGGFSGVEGTREERDWASNVAIIDGANAHGCVTGANDATLDGFTVTRGSGGWGSGMLNNNASPLVANCTFSGNVSTDGAGGIYNGNSSATIINCTFLENSGGHMGGGIYNYTSTVSISDCDFTGNSAEVGGGI